MDISVIPNETWNDLVLGKVNCEFNFLALKILLARVQMQIRKDPQQAAINAGVTELKGFLQKMGQLPAAQKDIEIIHQLRSRS